MAIVSSILKWSLRTLVLAVALVVVGLWWVDFQLDRFAGARTPEIDPAPFAHSARLTAITNVHVLSADGETMQPGHTVVFNDSGILAVGETVEIPENADTLDGGGRYLIPGLVDAHVHLKQSPNDLLVYVATGVTGIREMSGNADHLAWRQQIRDGRLGPTLFVASEKLESHGWLAGHFQRWTRQRINVRRPGDAARTVASLAAQGYDAAKLGSLLDAEVYDEVCRAAAQSGLPVVGHLPITVSLDTLWASQQGELAHIEEIVKALDAEFGYFGNSRREEFLAFVERRSNEVSAKLAEHGIAVVSSLWLIESIPRQKLAPAEVIAGIELAYANPGLVEGTPLSKGWLPGHNAYELGAEAGAQEREAHAAYWTTFAQAHHVVLRAMRDQGVRVMAGTDANTAGVVPGFSLHDELESLVAAGLSPAQALRAATAAPAEQMKLKAGRLAPGYPADMVLLDANPLDAIGNTRSISTVVLGGRVLRRSTLDAMLAAVRSTHEESRRIVLPEQAPDSHSAKL